MTVNEYRFWKDDKRKKIDGFFEEHRKTLDLFLEHGAITKEQYNKSLRDLTKNYDIKSKREEKQI